MTGWFNGYVYNLDIRSNIAEKFCFEFKLLFMQCCDKPHGRLNTIKLIFEKLFCILCSYGTFCLMQFLSYTFYQSHAKQKSREVSVFWPQIGYALREVSTIKLPPLHRMF